MFRINIKTGNAAFADGDRAAELARILREIAGQLDQGDSVGRNSIQDINGNTVGEWSLK